MSISQNFGPSNPCWNLEKHQFSEGLTHKTSPTKKTATAEKQHQVMISITHTFLHELHHEGSQSVQNSSSKFPRTCLVGG